MPKLESTCSRMERPFRHYHTDSITPRMTPPWGQLPTKSSRLTGVQLPEYRTQLVDLPTIGCPIAGALCRDRAIVVILRLSQQVGRDGGRGRRRSCSRRGVSRGNRRARALRKDYAIGSGWRRRFCAAGFCAEGSNLRKRRNSLGLIGTRAGELELETPHRQSRWLEEIAQQQQPPESHYHK